MKKSLIFFLIALAIFLLSFRLDWQKVKRVFFENPLLSENMEKFSEFEIENKYGKNLFNKDSQDDWLMNNLWHADKRIIYKFRNLLYQTKIEKKIPYASKEALQKFGLKNPWANLTFEHNGKDHVINFGDRSPVGINYYAMASWHPKQVLLLNFTRLFDMLKEDSFQWQDRRLLYEISDAKKAIIKLPDYEQKFVIDFIKEKVICENNQKINQLSILLSEFLEILDKLKYSYQQYGNKADYNLNYPEMIITLFGSDNQVLRNVKISRLGVSYYCHISDNTYAGKIFMMEPVQANIMKVLSHLCDK